MKPIRSLEKIWKLTTEQYWKILLEKILNIEQFFI
jgi:hypothetical protein